MLAQTASALLLIFGGGWLAALITPEPAIIALATTLAGLLDEIHIDLAAVLLGAGVRLFDRLANTPLVLGNPTVVTGVGVTHLRYPVHTS